ncbi:MAG: hypothetical protein AAF985_20520, partial [Bacteroidota bacterium]
VFAKTGADWGIYEPLREYIEAAEIHLAFAQSIVYDTLSYSDEFKLHIPLISELETGRRATQASGQQVEVLARESKAQASSAID